MKQLAWRVLNEGVKHIGGSDGVVKVRRQGVLWSLRTGHFLDRSIIIHGKFETRTTRRLRAAVWPGFRMIDVGANFGYFSLLVAHWAGSKGEVWAFEPTREFRHRLEEHIAMNQMASRIQVLDYGLSDHSGELSISVGDSSATLHPIVGGQTDFVESIHLRTLDEVAIELALSGVDFIKVDIDGHEPRFLTGAEHLIREQRPAMVMEFNQANLDVAGSDVRVLYQQLIDLGYELYSDITGRRYVDRTQFLVECGNYTHSANVWAMPFDRPDLHGRYGFAK